MASARIESLKFLVPLAVVIILLLLLPGTIARILSILLLLLFGFILYFFRDPERTAPEDSTLLTAPADGVVTHVEMVEAPFDLGRMKRISIFLSVFDVHVNRIPCDGTIVKSVHTPGLFLDARAEDCAIRNERMDWLLETPQGTIVVRQIAGLIARRIVPWLRIHQTVIRGQRMGLIRFGSRTDLFLPIDCEVLVHVGERVCGGATPVARWGKASFEEHLSKSEAATPSS